MTCSYYFYALAAQQLLKMPDDMTWLLASDKLLENIQHAMLPVASLS